MNKHPLRATEMALGGGAAAKQGQTRDRRCRRVPDLTRALEMNLDRCVEKSEALPVGKMRSKWERHAAGIRELLKIVDH